jgi:hypothetical protein
MFKIKPLYLAGIIAVITIIMMYLDSTFFETKKSFLTYIKNVILCTGLSMGVYKIFGQSETFNKQPSNYNMNNIAEPMFHGMPSNY